MKNKAVQILLVAVLALSLGSCTALSGMTGKKKQGKFKTEKVSKGNIRETVSASGTINAITSVSVGAQVSGRIKELFVDFNSQVKKGQLIATVDPAIYDAQVQQANANYMAARANLDRAQVTAKDAKRTYDRATELFAKGLIAMQDRDTADTNNLAAKAAVGAAQAAVAQMAAALNMAQTNLQYTKIISPVDGVVISRNVDIGQTVVAAFQAPVLFLIAQDLTKMQIDTTVNEADIGKVKVGQEVDFTVDAYPDVTFKGKVSQVRNAPMTVQNVVTYDVVIYLDNPELKLKPGMTANATIITASKQSILRIPNAALRFVPTAEEGHKSLQKGYGVYVAENDEPKRVSITVGISDDQYTELTGGELKEGQELIIASLEKSAKDSRPPKMF